MSVKPLTQDLSITQRDYSIYLPAISTFYNMILGNYYKNPDYFKAGRIPTGFENGLDGMNFLDPENGYFYYKYGLYSAGHATLDLTKTLDKDYMVQHRDRKNTVMLGDSGGFQIGKGVIKFDWDNFKGESADKTRLRILNWLEYTADWSMILDVPAWACDDLHTKKTGLKTFKDCLDGTIHNNNFFLKHRLGETKFLNVLQGNNWDDCQTWYDAVKDFPFEGWAMGGQNMCNMEIALKRLIIMRDEGKLEGKDWIHFLGTAQIDWSCFLTSVQRELRKTVNPNVSVSYDCASPFVATANGLVYTDPSFSPKKWSIAMDKAPDNKLLNQSTMDFPWTGPIGSRLQIKDICTYGPGDMNRIGKIGKTSWDTLSYSLLMAHNVWTHITAVQKANRLSDIECANYQPDWKHWRKLKERDTSDELSTWVPRDILYFDRFVKELFASETPMDMISQARSFLGNVSSGRRKKDSNVNDFFGFGDDLINHTDDPDAAADAETKLLGNLDE